MQCLGFNVRFTRYRMGRRKVRRWAPREWAACHLTYGSMIVHLTTRRGYGISCTGTTKDGVHRAVWDGVAWVGDLIVKKKKAKDTAAGPQPHLAAVESVVFGKLFSLVAHCAATAYDDGDARQTGWWTVKTMGSAWVVEVKDPDTCARLVVVQQTLDDALMLASLLLDSEEAPWEPDPWLTAAKAKKKK